MVTKAKAATRCPVTLTLELIGGRWKVLILFHLASGTKRFGEVAVRIPDISRKVLTEQLKELEKDGLVTRTQYKEIPPRVEYALTELGASLTPLFSEMAKWGNKNLASKRALVG
ncbi:MAG: helix-turn-helix domain-containing protein [Chitinophagales bacterium]